MSINVRRINTNIWLLIVFSMFLFLPNAVVADQKESPGTIGYATSKYNSMSSSQQKQLTLLLRCAFVAEAMGLDDKVSKFLAKGMNYAMPIWWNDHYTEVVSYQRGYVDGMYSAKPEILARIYDETCRPLIYPK